MVVLMRWIFCVIAVLCFTGCSSSQQTTALVIPDNVVSDSVVVPSDVQAAYEQLTAELQSSNFERWELLTGVATAASQPLEFRRALVYHEFKDMHAHTARGPTDVIEIYTLPGDRDNLERLVTTIAAQIGFEHEDLAYDDWPGNGNHVNDSYRTGSAWLRSRRALSTGEFAWIADWIMLTYGGSIARINPPSLVYPTGI